MTVAELITKLSAYPADRKVWVWNSDGEIALAADIRADKFDDETEIIVFVEAW